MLKRINQVLNIIISSSVGIFIGYSLFQCWDVHTHPDLYAMQSAPWYTSILVYGIVTCIVLAVCMTGKTILQKTKKQIPYQGRRK